MDEAEANRIQTEWCHAEVARIQSAGERYLNGRMLGHDPVTPTSDDIAAIEPYAGSVKQKVRMLLEDGRARTAREIASALSTPVDFVYTAIGRLRNDGWGIDTLDDPSGSKRYQWARVETLNYEPRGITGWYRRLLSDAKEHNTEEFLRLGGSREDMHRRIWELRRSGMHIVSVNHPGGRRAYQWRP